jgi:hypothetical protein
MPTLYTIVPLSVNTRWHHLPSRARLNSLNCLTPKPPYSLRKQIVFYEIQEVFLRSSPPPQKKLIKRDSIDEIVPAGALKKEIA